MDNKHHIPHTKPNTRRALPAPLIATSLARHTMAAMLRWARCAAPAAAAGRTLHPTSTTTTATAMVFSRVAPPALVAAARAMSSGGKSQELAMIKEVRMRPIPRHSHNPNSPPTNFSLASPSIFRKHTRPPTERYASTRTYLKHLPVSELNNVHRP